MRAARAMTHLLAELSAFGRSVATYVTSYSRPVHAGSIELTRMR